MRAHVSPGTGRRYPLTMICQVFRVSRSSVYAAQAPPAPAGPPGKRGPKTRWVDAELVAGIRAILAASPFHGEGYRKIRARLAHRGLAGQRQARPAPDAPARPARAAAAGPAERRPRARGHDHHRSAGRDVGHRCDPLLHRAGRLVLVLRRHRPRDRRAPRLARREARRSLGGPGADPPGRPPRLRRASGRTSPAGSRSAATGARSTSPMPGSTR